MADIKQIIKSQWFEWTSRVVLALFYLNFVHTHGTAWLEGQRVSSLLLAIYETVIIGLVLFRKPAKELSTLPSDWFVGPVRMLLPLLLIPALVPHEHVVFATLQATGTAITMIGALSLNTSFGVVAANRGVKTGGIFRFMRHPLYSGYVLSTFAYLAQNFTLHNGVVAFLFFVFMVASIVAEEGLLSKDPEYAAYMQKTKWRLLPYIW